MSAEQKQMEKSQPLTGETTSPRWRGALKELQIDTEKHHQMQDFGELTPDSMSSRLSASSAANHLNRDMDELFADNMNSRVTGFVA